MAKDKAEIAVQSTPMTMLQQMIDKGIDPKAISDMMDLSERWQAGESAKAYALAISGFQSECPMVFKAREVRKQNGDKLYNFANYEDIKRVTRDLEKKYGISTSFTIDLAENGMMKGTIRIRVGNHFEDKTLSVPIPKGINTNSTQEFGMAVSYLKRYLYCAALDVVVSGEDNDARGLYDRISPTEMEEVNNLIDQIKDAAGDFNHAAFKHWLMVEDLADIPSKKVEMTINELKRKLKKVKG